MARAERQQLLDGPPDLSAHVYYEALAESEEEVAALENELATAREALEFYANERRYEVDEDGAAIYWDEYEGDPILHDGGQVARAALAGAVAAADTGAET